MNPADAPAYLPCGGFNRSPPPALHIAYLRDWGQRFGAVPIAMTREVVECVVKHPPQTPTESLILALEQFIYCDDIVAQVCGSIQDLAIALWQSPHWRFWWD